MAQLKVGYTELQAGRLVQKIDRQVEKVCEEIARLEALVPDSYTRTEYLQGQIRGRGMEMVGVVRRRQR